MYYRRLSKFFFQHAKTLLLKQVCNLRITTRVPVPKLVYACYDIPVDNANPKRFYSNNGDLIVDSDSFEDNVWEELSFDTSFKKILYPENDPTLERINACSSAQEILDLYHCSGRSYAVNQQVQTIILLWDFYRKSINGSDLQKTILSHQAFQALIDDLTKSINILDLNESTCCYLYLKRIGLESNHKLMQNLQLHILDKIGNVENIPLSALSRFSVAISADKDFNSTLIYCNLIPHIVSSLKACTSAEDIRLVTICLSNLRQLVSSEILDTYKEKISEFITIRRISSTDTKCVLKILNFLNHPVWSHQNFTLSRQLLLLLLPIVEDLHQNEVKAVFKVFQSHLEPAAIVPNLLKVSERLLEKYPTPEILSCVVQYVEPKKREHFINIFKNLLTDNLMWQLPNTSSNFFTILRSLKISDSSLCDEYWSRILKGLQSHSEENEHYIYSKHCHRYMYFNNNLGGTYRHIEFEKHLTQLCLKDITTGISGMIPSKFANIAPFVIGYGHTYKGNVKLPNVIVSKIQSMAGQFSVVDSLQLSRGIQIALEMRFRHFIPKTLAAQLNVINEALDACTQRHLDELKKSDANDLNVIVRSLNNRKACKKSAIYLHSLKKYNEININTLNSRLLRSMSFNLSTSHFVAPEIIEKMFEYVVKNNEYVTGDTAEKILSCSYSLGYSPQMQEGISSSANIIMRDFDYMTGLSIIQACLALCFYKAIPEQLINKVFCVDFIKRVEEEIEMCYSKATYPERVLNQVMQLNRAVCLDFPEADVPWFQQNYLEAQLSKHPYVQNKYSEEVKKCLLSVFKDECLFRCNHVTPYGYRIDFVIHFDNRKNPISAPVETTVLDKITRVAILLLKLDSLCQNDFSTLKGKDALKMRHLEMLGYNVVYVNEKDWKDMNAQGDKINYLKCLLQINS